MIVLITRITLSTWAKPLRKIGPKRPTHLKQKRELLPKDGHILLVSLLFDRNIPYLDIAEDPTLIRFVFFVFGNINKLSLGFATLSARVPANLQDAASDLVALLVAVFDGLRGPRTNCVPKWSRKLANSIDYVAPWIATLWRC